MAGGTIKIERLDNMSSGCLEVPIPKDRFEKLSQTDQNWMVVEMLQSLDKRICALESKRLFDERMLTLGSIGGGIIGGLATVLGIKIS